MYFVVVELNLHCDYRLIVNLICVSAKLVAVSEEENTRKVEKKRAKSCEVLQFYQLLEQYQKVVVEMVAE